VHGPQMERGGRGKARHQHTFKASSGRLSLAYMYMRLLVVATEYDKLRAGMSRQNRRSACDIKTRGAWVSPWGTSVRGR